MQNFRYTIFFAALLATGSYADVDISDGQETFESICSSCHGEQGEGSEDFAAPRLAGQHGWYLKTQLINFRAAVRGAHQDDENGQTMQPMAEDLEDQDIDNLVAYIETLQ